MERIDWKRYGIQEAIKLKERRERDRTGLYYVDGLRFVVEALRTDQRIQAAFIAPSLLHHPYGEILTDKLKRKRIPCLSVAADLFDRLSPSVEKQGIGAVIHQRLSTPGTARPGSYWVAVETIRSPGNLGTLIRSCDAAGAAGVIFIGPSTDPFDPGCVRASMGSIFAVPLIRMSHGEFGQWARRYRVQIVGADSQGGTDYRFLCFRRPTVLLMGSERKGLSEAQRALCTTTVRIPMVGRCDSLNLGVAGSLLVFEAFRQAGPDLGPPPYGSPRAKSQEQCRKP